jgi:hypothetical protein
MPLRRFALAALLALTRAPVVATPPAQADSLRQLRFSPDGQYVLAQDASGIAILTVSPLAVLYRTPAEFADDAQFTPDSLQFIFVSSLARADRQPIADGQRVLLVRSAPHVERWRVADGTRIRSTEIRGLSCETEQLSQDGRTLACADSKGTLRFVDVASGETFFERKQFVKLIPLYRYLPGGFVDLPNGQFLGDLGEACFDFSPDGRFLTAKACGGTGTVVVCDLRDRSLLKLARHLRSMMEHTGSVFVTGSTLLIGDGPYRAKQHIKIEKLVAFPSGKILSRPRVPPNQLFRAADPGFVIARPLAVIRKHDPNAPTFAVALRTGQVIVSHTPALDVFGRYYIAESGTGEAGLYELGKGLQATVALYNK